MGSERMLRMRRNAGIGGRMEFCFSPSAIRHPSSGHVSLWLHGAAAVGKDESESATFPKGMGRLASRFGLT